LLALLWSLKNHGDSTTTNIRLLWSLEAPTPEESNICRINVKGIIKLQRSGINFDTNNMIPIIKK
jgi:hypothetical protein